MRVLLITGIICCSVGLFGPIVLEWDMQTAAQCRCAGCGHGDCNVNKCACSMPCRCHGCEHSPDEARQQLTSAHGQDTGDGIFKGDGLSATDEVPRMAADPQGSSPIR